MSVQLLVDILGWIASVELIAAYALLSAQKLHADSPLFQWLNLTGSIFLIANTYYYGAFPSTVVNIFWLLIATFALYKIMRSKGDIGSV